jgi:uncharacterized damage-inducible protein DinB
MENEVQDLLTELRIIKGQILETGRGLDDTASNWQPLSKDTNSIYATISHIIGAQNNWIRKIIAGQEIQRDREAELHSAGSIKEILDRFEKESLEIEIILSRLDSSCLEETREVPVHPQGKATVGWCILHVLTHNAVHLGHLQLTRQAWEQKFNK